MNEWLNALLFGVALVAFVVSISSIIMGATASGSAEKLMQQRVEYGFFGVSGIVICLLMVYALV